MRVKPDAKPIPPEASADVRTDLEVDAWFVETFSNVPGLTTEWHNRFREAADNLKARLRRKEE